MLKAVQKTRSGNREHPNLLQNHLHNETNEVTTVSLPYDRELVSFARKLRRDMTKQERHLWYDFLRKHPARFQRQKSIGEYIADFCCHDAKLVVELDGAQHYEDEAKQ